mmetsp:Transcript_48127/g.114673  ORF Transcript_48127/g.114673 Transcript_48127/m.114673 type:complete len:214 (-) Transcript_48127:1224-1865(-)
MRTLPVTTRGGFLQHSACAARLARQHAVAVVGDGPGPVGLPSAGGGAMAPVVPVAKAAGRLGLVIRRLRAASSLVQAHVTSFAAIHLCLQHISESELLVGTRATTPFPIAPVREYARHWILAGVLIARLRLSDHQALIVDLDRRTGLSAEHRLLDDAAHAGLPAHVAALAAGCPLLPFGELAVNGMRWLAWLGLIPCSYARQPIALRVHQDPA